MATTQKQESGALHVASARMSSQSISTKHSIEISRYLRFKTSGAAKKILEDVIAGRKAIPFVRYNNDVGHKSGIAGGRYPMKAAKAFLQLVKSVEANAEDIGLNASSLKITHLLANKASIPMTGGRTKGATKRTHIEIKVAEFTKTKKARANKKSTETKKPVQKEKVANSTSNKPKGDSQ